MPGGTGLQDRVRHFRRTAAGSIRAPRRMRGAPAAVLNSGHGMAAASSALRHTARPLQYRVLATGRQHPLIRYRRGSGLSNGRFPVQFTPSGDSNYSLRTGLTLLCTLPTGSPGSDSRCLRTKNHSSPLPLTAGEGWGCSGHAPQAGKAEARSRARRAAEDSGVLHPPPLLPASIAVALRCRHHAVGGRRDGLFCQCVA